MDYVNNLISRNTVIRRVILAVLVLVTFLIQNTAFPSIGGAHAVLLIPLTVCVAMFEREFAGMFFGLFAGAMLDAFSSDSTVFNSIIFTVIGFTAGALITYVMRNNLVCAAILTLGYSVIYTTLNFIFYYAFNGLEKPVAIYFRYYFVSAIYTVIFTPLFYLIIREIYKKLKD